MINYNQFTARFENSPLYNNTGGFGFYYDKGLNLGFGFNLSLNDSFQVGKALDAAGINFTQDQLNIIVTIANEVRNSNIHGPATELNSMFSSGIAVNQTQSYALLDYYMTNVARPALLRDLKTYAAYSDQDISNIPEHVLAGLQDFKYNANGAIRNDRPGGIVDALKIAKLTGDWSKVAYTIGYSPDTEVPNRRDAEAKMILGFDPNTNRPIDGNCYSLLVFNTVH